MSKSPTKSRRTSRRQSATNPPKSPNRRKAMSVIGWEPILAELAVFFAVLRHAPLQEMSPCNLCMHGPPGSNKSMGLFWIAEQLGFTVGKVDCAQIEDITDLAGVVDLRANRLHGKASMIAGDLLNRDILILDELPNASEQVMRQMRGLLQYNLVVLGKPFPIQVQCFLATCNLKGDTVHGEGRDLESPEADRFGMILRSVSVWEMKPEDRDAITRQRDSPHFLTALKRAYNGILQHIDQVESDLGESALSYVEALGAQLQGTDYAFQGRRLQLLFQFALAGLSLCRAEPARISKDVLLAVARACLSYHRLSGSTLDESALLAAHETAFHAIEGKAVDALIAAEPAIEGKMALLLAELNSVSPASKAGLIERVISEGSIAQKIALLQLVEHPRFRGEPAELLATVRRMTLPMPNEGVPVIAGNLAALAVMSQAEISAFEHCGGDKSKCDQLLREAKACLRAWGITKP